MPHNSARDVNRNVSVIMVSYNTGPVLWRSIESVLMQEELHELIIIDNGNPTEVRNKLQEMETAEPRLKLIFPKSNLGFASGCNLGAKQATAEYLLLLNPDCILPRHTFSMAIDALNAYPEASVAGCRIMNPDNTEQSGSRRRLLTPWIAMVEFLKLYYILPDHPLFQRIHLHEAPVPDKPEFVPAISGAFMMVKAATYHELGGIDEEYFFHVEDLDFCYQVYKKGGKILYIPQISVVHYRSTSYVSPFFIEWNKTRGFSRYFSKNFGKTGFPGLTWLIIVTIYLRLFLRAIALSGTMLLNGKASLEQRRRLDDAAKRAAFLDSYSQLEPLTVQTADNSSESSIFLAGASGQVGLAILRRLLAANKKVTALYHSTAINFSHPNLTWKQGDLFQDTIDMENVETDTLVYTPALWLLPPLLDDFYKAGVRRLICFSSTSIVAKANSGNSFEKSLVAKFVWGEQEVAKRCNELGIKWTILRPTLIYGIGFDHNVCSVRRFIKSFGFFPVASPSTGLRQPVHADDLAIAVMSMLHNPGSYSKSFNLCGGEQLEYREMVGRIFDALGKKRLILPIRLLPFFVDMYSIIRNRPDINGEIARRMNHNLIFDDSEARDCFNYQPRAFLSAGINDLEPDFSK